MALNLPEAIIGVAGGSYFVNVRKSDFLDPSTNEFIASIYLPYAISEARRNRFLAEVQRIDALIDLDFLIEPWGQAKGAVINIIQKRDPDVFGGVPGYSTDYGDIALNLDKLDSDKAYGNTLLHELGHVIGLNHPWEDGGPGGEAEIIDDKDRFSDEDTIMAYRSKKDDEEKFRDSDITGLQMIWGVENGSQPQPTYTVTALANSVNEGSTLNFVVDTTAVAPGTRLYWKVIGNGIRYVDFGDGAAFPSFPNSSLEVGNDGKGLISLPISNDYNKEGAETLILRLYSDDALLKQIGESKGVTLRDTSTSVPSSSYLLAAYNTLDSNKEYSDPITNYRIKLLPEGGFGIKGPGTEDRYDRLLPRNPLVVKFTDNISFDYAELESVFDQVKGFDDITGQVFRLYNAAFKRIPDGSGLQYWIQANASQNVNLQKTSYYFIQSAEFAERYGSSSTNQEFASRLYNNVLGRDPDPSGLRYWVDILDYGRLDRAGVLVEFAQSIENKSLFTEITGLA